MKVKDLARLLKMSIEETQKMLDEKDEISINLKEDINSNVNKT